jgi:hypothetical protein
MRRLSYRQVLDLVAGKPVDELILVGGQAVNAWAEALGLADESSAEVYGAALSDDIDFLGLAPAAIALADALGARVAIATMDEHTPNAAVLTFDFEGEKNIIDVLHSLKGFSHAELQRVRDWAAVPEMPEAMQNKLRVMHPAHCLQSQLENVYGVLNRRAGPDGERNANRIRLTCEIGRRTLQRYVDEGEAPSARALFEKVYELARRPPALRALVDDAIDVTAGLCRDPRLGADFLDKRLGQLERYLCSARDKYRRRGRTKG